MMSHMDAMSAMDAMTVNMAKIVPKKTQTKPARPPFVRMKSLVLVARMSVEDGRSVGKRTIIPEQSLPRGHERTREA